jgi:phosphatidylglycerol:prolipoprotein diacylglycerol transferase
VYPNLYYVFKDWFGVEWRGLAFLNTFGLMVAIAFIVGAIVLTSELKRKEKLGLLFPKEETIIVGKPASLMELLINFVIGFLFAYKIVGVLVNKPDDINAQEYIFSRDGNLIAGIIAGLFFAGLKWWDKNKQKQKEPEQRVVRIWPHDRVGDLVIIALIFGILGAKLFDDLENWGDFIKHPLESLLSPSGLTFYGGLITAAIAIFWYAYKRNIRLVHLCDSAAPALMIAYAIGRIGCQVAGDGDWGIFNSAYITNPATAKVMPVTPDEYQQQLKTYDLYFLQGKVVDSGTTFPVTVTDRTSPTLSDVPAKSFTAPSFLPVWIAAYNYPGNVNKDGILIPGNLNEHNRVLPVPVFPTPFYETIICTFLFLFLWSLRTKIKQSGSIFSIYLILNGLERFIIEKIRVNIHYSIFGLSLSQAEIIAFLLIISGLLLLFISVRKKSIAVS